jgi:chromosome segregation ATPase
MQQMHRLAAFAASAAVAHGDSSNPMAKVFELMDECAAKVKADGEAEAKAYNEFFEWCDDAAKNTQFEIKTYKSEKEKLEATIGETTATIDTATSKIEELAAAIASDEKELKEATAVREKEVAEFQKAEAELVDTVDTLERAVAILEREMSKSGGAAFAQLDTNNLQAVTQALGAIVDAAGFKAVQKDKLMALVQSRDDDDDDDVGAPAAKTYESKAGSIVDVLGDMKEKAETELADLRKAESNTAHNYDMLKQSLDDQIAADTKSKEEEESKMAAAEEEKATAEGDLAEVSKNLAAAESELSTLSSDCMTTAADHEASVKAREEELAVIAKAKKILEETSGGAVEASYSFLQTRIQTRADLKKAEIAHLLKSLAKKHHSRSLAQLASKVSAVVKYGVGSDVFEKIKSLITDMIAKLEKEAEDDATEKAYCDEEMGKTESKKGELEEDLGKVTAKLDEDAANSARLKEEVKEAQKMLAELAAEQQKMDEIRSEQHADYVKTTDDLKLGLSGVQKALDVLRDYYGGAAAFVQDGDSLKAAMDQPKVPSHQKSGGAGGSIINILEVCESDFSDNLAKAETEESDSVSEYESISQQNKVTKTTLDQDVKYKTQEFKGLDKGITDLNADKDTLSTELKAVNEYYAQLKDRCVAKPESYEERKKRREEEIAGLKQAMQVLEEESAFIQRKGRRGLRGHLSP